MVKQTRDVIEPFRSCFSLSKLQEKIAQNETTFHFFTLKKL